MYDSDNPIDGQTYNVTYNLPVASETNTGNKTLATVEDIDVKIAAQDFSSYAIKSEVNAALATKADLNIVYTKSEMDAPWAMPADCAD